MLSAIILSGVGLSMETIHAAKHEGTKIQSNEQFIDGRVDLVTPLEDQVVKYSDRAPKPSQVILDIPFQTQQTDYYCGPAAAAMVVNSLGYSKTQDQMARLLGTTESGTAAGNGVANALNNVVRGSKYKFNWEWQNYNEVAKMKGHVMEALSYGNPVIVNTVESPGDVYLAGHNIGTYLYHFGIIGDYFNYGNEVTYVDPGYGRYGGFQMNQRVSIKNMSYAAGTRGYVW